jgi:MarR family transcriptional regulator, multiple antibiotic resistance protein MarR
MTGDDGAGATVADALRETSVVLERIRSALAQRLSVTTGDTVVLSELGVAADHRLRPADLAHRLSLGSGTVTAMIDRLEGAGLAERTPNPDDRRSSLIALSERGRRALDAGRQLIAEAADRALDAQAQAVLARDLLAVVQVLGDLVERSNN